MKDIINTDRNFDPAKIQDMVARIQKLKFDENDAGSRAAIKEFYDTQINIVRTEDERIMLMASLNDMTEFSCHVIGKLLVEEEESIKRRYSDWLKTGSDPDKKPLYKTINGFLIYYKKTLGIGSTKAYYCMDLYRRYDIDDILELGVRNVVNISIIKDDDLLNEVVKYSKNNDLSPDEMQGLARAMKEVEKIKDEKVKKKMALTLLKAPDQEKRQKKLEEVKAAYVEQVQDEKDEQERIFKEVAFSVEIESNNKLTITMNNKKQRDYMNKALHYYERAIKSYIAKCVESEGK